jgi:hypothetical protein
LPVFCSGYMSPFALLLYQKDHLIGMFYRNEFQNCTFSEPAFHFLE